VGPNSLIFNFGPLLDLALRLGHQEQCQRAPKGLLVARSRDRVHPSEFGCKVSIAIPVSTPTGGQFVLHAKALHGNPYDGHTLGPLIADLEKLTAVPVRRIHGDKDHRSQNYPNRLKVWISGSSFTAQRDMKRGLHRPDPEAKCEPVIRILFNAAISEEIRIR
jgi:transposase, IS5 family